MTEFKVGDVVVLNSGGPMMVICTVPTICVSDSYARASCTWIAPSGKAQGATFKLACLRRPTPKDEWAWREAGRLPAYANRRSSFDVCQDCGGAVVGGRRIYGIKRWAPIVEGSSATFEVIDWLTICDPCARARGFKVPE